jgi:hypothetical protein
MDGVIWDELYYGCMLDGVAGCVSHGIVCLDRTATARRRE